MEGCHAVINALTDPNVDGDEQDGQDTTEYPPGARFPEQREQVRDYDLTMLEDEKFPLLGGLSKDKLKRIEAWTSIPTKARVAIRRLHSMWNHVPNSVLKNILKIAKADPALIAAVDHFSCPTCEKCEPKKQTSKSAPPRHPVRV